MMGSMFTKMWRSKATLVVALLLVLVYVINAVLILFFQPRGDNGVTKTDEHGITYTLSDGLQPSIFFSHDISGYVNVVSPKNVVNLDKRAFDERSPIDRVFLIAHESLHIKQKELVAERSGGYPSYLNPIVTARYAHNLLELNSKLREIMPDGDAEWFREGLESSADCYAQTRFSGTLPSMYVGGTCSDYQKKVAVDVYNGVWPD